MSREYLLFIRASQSRPTRLNLLVHFHIHSAGERQIARKHPCPFHYNADRIIGVSRCVEQITREAQFFHECRWIVLVDDVLRLHNHFHKFVELLFQGRVCGVKKFPLRSADDEFNAQGLQLLRDAAMIRMKMRDQQMANILRHDPELPQSAHHDAKRARHARVDQKIFSFVAHRVIIGRTKANVQYVENVETFEYAA